MLRVGIIGGAGYTAGELLRILLNHPEVSIVFVHSESNALKPLWTVHSGLFGETDMCFSDSAPLESIDVLFLCSGHGKSSAFWQEHPCPGGLKIIDLAQDFRDESQGYVYGLPELQKERIKGARKVANPGCFATAIQLCLLPLAKAGVLPDEVHVTALTGSTGAGVKPSATTHFSYRSSNLSVYKPFTHQHIPEIVRSLQSLQPSFPGELNFIPMRGDFTRGILASVHLKCALDEDEVKNLYEDYYKEAAFTFFYPLAPDIKQVVNTNKCLVGVEKHGEKLMVTSVIDNLLKGASGQAVQNMNLMCGLPEDTGLRLKASAF